MTITITHKGITVCIQRLGNKPEVAIQLIKETIDAINIVEPVSAICEITKEELSAVLQRTINRTCGSKEAKESIITTLSKMARNNNCTLEKSEGYGMDKR